MKIYTRTGDRGETSLFGGERVLKSHARIEAYGTIDELNSHLGVVRAAWKEESPLDEILDRVQMDLFEVGAFLASPGQNRFSGAGDESIAMLEREIDRLETTLTPLVSFILPGGTFPAAQLHVARTVCRRAERLVVALEDESAAMVATIGYLNRLSDFLFVAARFASSSAGIADVRWLKR